MIGRGPNKGKAKGDVDPAIALDHFERNQALIMVEGNNPVKESVIGAVEKSVGGEGTFHPDPAPPGRPDGRLQDRLFFLSEKAPLPGMRIEPAEGEVWPAQAKVEPEHRFHPLKGLHDARGAERRRDLPEREMAGDEEESEFFPNEGHLGPTAAG